MDELAVPLKSIRQTRAKVVQKLQDVVPAVVLVGDGLTRVGGASASWSYALGALEIGSGLLVVWSFVQALRSVRRRPADGDASHAELEPRIDWSDIYLGTMLVIEVIAHHEETGHWKRPTMLTAAAAFAFGLFHRQFEERVERRRALRVTDDGIRILHPFRGLTAAWGDVTSFDVSDTEAVIVTSAGKRRRIDLKDVTNLRDVKPVLVAAQTRWRESVRP